MSSVSPTAPPPPKTWSPTWFLTFGGRLPSSGAETFAMGASALLLAVGAFGASITGKSSVPGKVALAACIGGTFGWNLWGGNPLYVPGLGGAERFGPVNAQQQKELREGGETTRWKRLSINGLFQRSSMQALIGGLAGGSAWMIWAVGSAYAGPAAPTVRNVSFAIMLILSGVAGWSMTHGARMRLLGLDAQDNPI